MQKCKQTGNSGVAARWGGGGGALDRESRVEFYLACLTFRVLM